MRFLFGDPIFYHILRKTVPETAEEGEEVPKGFQRRMPDIGDTLQSSEVSLARIESVFGEPLEMARRA